MKRFAWIITLLLATLACASALAMTTEEWNRGCTCKTRCATTIYRMVATQTDLGAPTEVPEAAGTIPAGTYLGSRQHSVDGLYEMSMLLNGQIVDYYVSGDAITEATRDITLPSGERVGVPELAYGNDEAVREYLKWGYPAEAIDEYLRAMHGEHEPAKAVSAAAKTGTAAKSLGDQPDARWHVTLLGEDEATETVGLIALGTYTSVILRGGATESVPTAQLLFGGKQSGVDERVAVVATKSTGYVSLRTGAYQNAPAQERIPDGTLVGVIEVGEEFTKVAYQGMMGYVVTRGLIFHRMDEEPLGYGVLAQRGKEYTSIFASPKQNSAWLGKWRQGETVTIVGEDGRYYEVEKDGLRGWLKKEYVKVQ